MAEETQKFKSKLKNGSKNFILDAIRVSSGHRLKTHTWGTDDYGNPCDDITEFIELQARNTNKGQAATLYIPVKDLDAVIKALQEVTPPGKQLCFGDLIEENNSANSRLIAKLKLNATNKSVFRKGVI